MADTDERSLARVRRMLDEDVPFLPAFDQVQLAKDSHYISRPIEIELLRYEAGRRRHVEFLAELEAASWARAGMHEEHGAMSIELYESHIASEDVDHMAQIAEVIELLGVVSSAPG